VINTKMAFFSELHDYFIENCKIFAPEGILLEHLVLLVFILYEESKGSES